MAKLTRWWFLISNAATTMDIGQFMMQAAKKIGFGVYGGLGSIFNDQLKNGTRHKLCSILMGISLVD